MPLLIKNWRYCRNPMRYIMLHAKTDWASFVDTSVCERRKRVPIITQSPALHRLKAQTILPPSRSSSAETLT